MLFTNKNSALLDVLHAEYWITALMTATYIYIFYSYTWLSKCDKLEVEIIDEEIVFI